MRIAIRTERGTWTNARWQRGAQIRHRLALVSVLCFVLCGCAAWPNSAMAFVGTTYEEGYWVIRWQTWGKEYHVETADRDSMRIVDTVLWRYGRLP